MAALSGYPSGQWTAADLAASRAGAQAAVTLPGRTTQLSSASWSLDERRQPFAQAQISSLTPNRSSTLAPGFLFQRQVGIAVNGKLVLSGLGESVDDLGDGRVVETWTNGDYLLDAAFTADYAVPDTYTHPKQISGPVWNEPYTGYPTDAPSADQLAAFRALDFSAGDSFGDSLRTAASAVGMRCRVDHLGRYDGTHVAGNIYPLATIAYAPLNPTYDANLAPTILASEIGSYHRRSDASEFASKLKVTAQWTTAGEQKSSTYLYSTTTDGNLASITKEITIQVRPPLVGGVRKLTADYPLALAYANAYARRQWLVTAEVRGWWWLEPGASLNITNPRTGIPDAGIVSAVNFTSAGITTITLRPA